MDRLPREIEAKQLNSDVFAAALTAHNVVVIRQLAPPALFQGILQRAQQVYAAREQAALAKARTAGEPDPDLHQISFIGIHELDLPGGPPHQILALFAASPLRPLLQHIMGRPMFFNQAESTCRRIPPYRPDLLIPFHQDGYFDLQPPWRHLNCWLPLVPCGAEAPGLEVLPLGLDRMLSPPALANQPVARYGFSECMAYAVQHLDKVWRPVMQPGDVLIMNEYAIHRSYGHPGMHQTRLNMELRFASGQDIPDALRQRYALLPLP